MMLRPFNADDALTFYRWYHDRRLTHYFRGFIHGASVAQCANAPQLIRGHILVGIDPDTQQLVGAVSLADLDSILRIYKLGLLVDPDWQHLGFGKALLTGGVEWAFNVMNAHKILIEIVAGDSRVIHGAEQAGFQHEGTLRETCYIDGRFHDEVVYGLLQREYRLN